MNKKTEYWINILNLMKHPEGGYFKEIYRAEELINNKSLPERYKGERNFSTSIYFLLDGNDKSHFHKLISDEIWHFYDGTTVLVYIIFPDGRLENKKLGNNFEEGEEFQVVIPKGTWFGAEVKDKNSFSLFGCTVAPGFDFSDFELAERENLISLYPEHKELIEKFTY